MPNRLGDAASPYLLQHADNPVDWYEWGPEAFAAAHDRDVPVLLSVGYSACHWCHVMAHESFEDDETAAYMNAHFVNVKVDREERPDVDRIYMDAVQAMTGRGGWPMTVFMTPDGEPFFAGTYFPKVAHGHHPTFMHVLHSVHDAWHARRDDLEQQARRLTEGVRRSLPPGDAAPIRTELLDGATAALIAQLDHEHGGFGGAPKFPQAPALELLARSAVLRPDGPHGRAAATALRLTLTKMAQGGIYDHLGGGFARYAVDRVWLVPHFEKMLYDNALLARIYLRGWQVAGDSRFRTVAEETLDYLLRDMRDPSGGFHAAEDADSEGAEGKFYVFTRAEFDAALGPDADLIARLYGVTEEGNFEGANVLHLTGSIDEAAATMDIAVEELTRRRTAADERLRDVRARRVRPGRDDKIVTAWNGLTLRALSEAAAVLGDRRYLDAAVELADFATTALRLPNGVLVRSWRDGRPGVPGFADDYAALAVGLYTLYQTTGDGRWFDEAERLTAELIERFEDPAGLGFFATAHDAERLISRPKNLMDNPTPSDNALAAEALLLHAALTGDTATDERLTGIARAAGRLIEQYPTAAAHLVAVLASTPIHEVAVVGSEDLRAPLIDVVWSSFRPDTVVAVGDGAPSPVPLLADRPASADRAVAYVCHEQVCALPVSSPDDLASQLDA